MRLGPLAPWGEPLQLCLSSHFGVAYLWAWVLTILCLCPSYLSHCGFFLISLVVQIFSASLQVVLIDSCSVNSCNFGVPV